MAHQFEEGLAEITSIEKAVILEHILYWVEQNHGNKTNLKNGKYWTYNTATAFQKRFTYFKEKSIARWLAELEKDGWIETGCFNKYKYDRTKWYTLGDLYIEWLQNNRPNKKGLIDAILGISQNDTGNSQNEPEISQNEPPIPNLSPEEEKQKDSSLATQSEANDLTNAAKEVLAYLNEKSDSSYKLTTKSHLDLIKARFNEGHTVEEAKKVIDYKCSEWLNDKKFCMYLQPQTLFCLKHFDNYVQAALRAEKMGRVNQVQPETVGLTERERYALLEQKMKNANPFGELRND